MDPEDLASYELGFIIMSKGPRTVFITVLTQKQILQTFQVPSESLWATGRTHK